MRWRLALLLLASCAAPAPVPARVSALPSVQVQSLAGQRTSLSAGLAGSVALIDLWATWCTACERERPKLARLDAAYRSRGLRVVALDVGEAPSVVTAYLARHPCSYPVFLDPDFELTDALGDKQLPTLLLVDGQGRIVHRSTSLDQETLDRIKALLPSFTAVK